MQIPKPLGLNAKQAQLLSGIADPLPGPRRVHKLALVEEPSILNRDFLPCLSIQAPDFLLGDVHVDGAMLGSGRARRCGGGIV